MPLTPAHFFPAGRALLTAALLCLLLAGGGCSLPQKNLPDDLGPGARDPLVQTALSQVGVRYRMGGESPGEGFDCSGLVMWTYARHGIKVPRTTSEQIGTGREVGKSSLQPGDIVCFRIGRGRHTGLYVGQGYFVHSPGTGKQVTVDSLNADYWKSRFSCGRRPAGRR